MKNNRNFYALFSKSKMFFQTPLIKLAIPTIIENFLQSLVLFVDSLFIAHISLTAVSAVGVVSGIMSILQAIFLAISIAATSLIARFLGAHKQRVAKNTVFLTLVMTVVLSLFIGILILFFAPILLKMAGANGIVLKESIPFFLWVGGACVFFALNINQAAILRASGDTVLPMKISLFINIVNILSDALLIFILHQGILGAGIGTTFARFLGCIFFQIAIQKTPLKITIHNLHWTTYLKPFFAIAIPTMVERSIMRIGDVTINNFILQMSATAFASFTIMENIMNFTYLPVFGLASSVAILMGRAIGGRQYSIAEKLHKQANILSFYTMCFVAVMTLFSSPFLVQWFTNDKVAINEMLFSFPICLLCLPILAFNLIDSSCLQVIGDAKTPMFATTIGILIFRVILVYMFCVHLTYGLNGVWIATIVDNLWRAIFLHFRLKKKLLHHVFHS